MIRAVRSELLKVSTTRLWWLLLLAALAATALSLAVQAAAVESALDPGPPPSGLPPEQAAALEAERERAAAEARSGPALAGAVAGLYTSGQFVGGLLVLLLGVLTVTGEFHHRTAGATFLVTPRRGRVVAAKLVAAALLGAGFWLATTVVAVAAGAVRLAGHGVGSQLGQGPVLRALLLNLAAYVLWAVFGVGFGALLRGQVAAVVTVTVLYLLGPAAVEYAADVVRATLVDDDRVHTAQVLAPAVAAQVMTTPDAFPHAPPPWVGALVLAGYGLVAAGLGALLVRRRDVG